MEWWPLGISVVSTSKTLFRTFPRRVHVPLFQFLTPFLLWSDSPSYFILTWGILYGMHSLCMESPFLRYNIYLNVVESVQISSQSYSCNNKYKTKHEVLHLMSSRVLSSDSHLWLVDYKSRIFSLYQFDMNINTITNVLCLQIKWTNRRRKPSLVTDSLSYWCSSLF